MWLKLYTGAFYLLACLVAVVLIKLARKRAIRTGSLAVWLCFLAASATWPVLLWSSFTSIALDRARAKAQALDLAKLVGVYLDTHDSWPDAPASGDKLYDPQHEHELIDILLRGHATGSGRMPEITFSATPLREGALCDPWGHPFCVVVDTDGDGSCTTPTFGVIRGLRCVVWSEGPEPIHSWDGESQAYGR